MRKYEKPTLEVIQLRVREDLANTSGNTTIYFVEDSSFSGFETFDMEPATS